MSDVHRLPDEQKVLQEASAWMARLKADDVTPADRERFRLWRTAHPMHGRVIDELTGTWNRLAARPSLARRFALEDSARETARRAEPEKALAQPAGRRATWAAATIALITGGALFACLSLTKPGEVYVTAIGERATISLPDGSILELDSNSRARVDISATRRLVRLERGEAFFKVVHNPQRPFLVIARSSWVCDVGTAFNVDVGARDVHVTVDEGTVKVGAFNPLLEDLPFDYADLTDTPALTVLTTGQEARLRGTEVNIRALTPEQLDSAASWRAGILYFENQPLAAVVKQMERYTRMNIVISDERLKQLPVGGTFRADPEGVEAFLTMLAQGLGLQVQRESGQVLIKPAAVNGS